MAKAKTERQNNVVHGSVEVARTIRPALLHASAPPATSSAPRRYCAAAAVAATDGLASTASATRDNLGLDDGGPIARCDASTTGRRRRRGRLRRYTTSSATSPPPTSISIPPSAS